MMDNKVLLLSDREKDFFGIQQQEIDVVCVGDSITGWNNIRTEGIEVPYGPYPTYPKFLQELLESYAETSAHVARMFVSSFGLRA